MFRTWHICIKTQHLFYVCVFMKYVGHEFTNGGPFFTSINLFCMVGGYHFLVSFAVYYEQVQDIFIAICF